jgi:hypothetical protein
VRATDAAGNTDPTPASRTWTVNRPPVANNDTAGVPQGETININVVANDTDPDGDTLTITSFTQPSRGTVTQASGTTLRYTAGSTSSGVGTFTFEYTISDGRGGTATATVTVTITASSGGGKGKG